MKPIVKLAHTEKVYIVMLENGNVYHVWRRKNKLTGSPVRWQIENVVTGEQVGENEEVFDKVKTQILTR